MSAALYVPGRVQGLVMSEHEVLVFDGATLHLLSGTAAHVWGALDGVRSVEEIVALVAPETGHPSARDEVRSFLGVLASRGLILSAPASAPGRLQIPPHVAWTESEGLVVVTNLHHGERFTLSDTASRIWTLVAAGISRQEAITAVAEEFPDAPASFATEIASLLDSLSERGLLLST